MSEKNNETAIQEEVSVVETAEDTSKVEISETPEPTEVEDNKTIIQEENSVVETPTVEKAQPKHNTDPKKGLNIWVVGAILIVCVGILFIVLKKSDSILVDPDEWAEGGWGHRSYIYVELDTASQADKSANFTFHAPEEIKGLTDVEYWIVEDYIYDLRYKDSDGQTSIILHKCEKNDLESADTATYKQINTVEIDGMEVIEKGADDKVTSVLWKKKGFYYQILTNEAYALDADEIPDLIASIE